MAQRLHNFEAVEHNQSSSLRLWWRGSGPLVNYEVCFAQDGYEMIRVKREWADVNDWSIDRDFLNYFVVANFLNNKLVIGVSRPATVQYLQNEICCELPNNVKFSLLRNFTENRGPQTDSNLDYQNSMKACGPLDLLCQPNLQMRWELNVTNICTYLSKRFDGLGIHGKKRKMLKIKFVKC